MRRRLLNLVTVASLAVSAATAALWVRSYRSSEWLGWVWADGAGGSRCVSLSVCRGSLNAGVGGWGPVGPYSRPARPPGFYHESDAPFLMDVNRLGFRTGRSNRTYFGPPGGGTTDWVTVPLWLVLALATAVPAARAAGWAHRRRRPGRGMCRQCGYDLRATPDRCPECGATP